MDYLKVLVFDLEGAGEGTCLVWHIYSNGDLTGVEVGMNAGEIVGCLALSNPITVTRNGLIAASISLEDGATELSTCTGDGESDAFTVITDGGMSESNAWIITDPDLNILGLPEGPTFDLEGAGQGTCLVWYASINGELTGVEVGANAADITGCFVLSNAITVTRTGVEGSTISLEGGGSEISICAGDGTSDAFTPIVEGGSGENESWIITDPELNILGLPDGPPFDLEGAGEGTCLIWHVNSVGDLGGVELGLNADDITGCYALSNPITVTRNGLVAAVIALESGSTELETCAGDGVPDAFTVITEGGMSESNDWIITDPDLNILGLPDGPTFDLEGAGTGTCLVWYASISGELSGVEVGANAGDIEGCFVLSNPITVTRKGVVGATITLEDGGTEITICAGDGNSDAFTASVEGGEGDNESWVITDPDLNILGLPDGPTFDLEGAGEGTCLVWHVYSNGELTGVEVGMNAADLGGCLALSNPITVTRNGVAGGSLALIGGGIEMTTCVGDGIPDEFTVFPDGMAIGENTKYIITDTMLNILGLPEGPTFDLEGAGEGVCLVWLASYNDTLSGVDVGANVADIEGCFALSNAVTIVRQSVSPSVLSLEGGGDALSICVGDGISDAFTPIVEAGQGEKTAWLITDPDGNILALPLDAPFDLEGAGPGTCLIWQLTYNGNIFNIDLGNNASEIEGCIALSNPITVVRSEIGGGQLSIDGGGTEITICAGDGVSDSFNVVIDSFIGESAAWIITDQDLNILGLPEAPPFDLEGAGGGVCLIWHASINGSLSGVEIGANAGDIQGCFALSNPITVTRVTEGSLCGGLLLSEHVDIYPNPSYDQIKITSEMRLKNGFSLQVYDMMGKMVLNHNNLKQDNMNLNIQSLAAGMYVLAIVDGQQNIMKQFIKAEE